MTGLKMLKKRKYIKNFMSSSLAETLSCHFDYMIWEKIVTISRHGLIGITIRVFVWHSIEEYK